MHKHSYFSWMIYCEFISTCIRITVTLTDEYLLLQSTCGPKKCLSWRVLVELCPGTNGILGNYSFGDVKTIMPSSFLLLQWSSEFVFLHALKQ